LTQVKHGGRARRRIIPLHPPSGLFLLLKVGGFSRARLRSRLFL